MHSSVVVAMATSLCLASSLTSFVAVDERTEAQTTTLTKVDILIAAPRRVRPPVHKLMAPHRPSPGSINLDPPPQRQSSGGCCGDDYKGSYSPPRDPQQPSVNYTIDIAVVGKPGVGRASLVNQFAFGSAEKPTSRVNNSYVSRGWERKDIELDGKTAPFRCYYMSGPKQAFFQSDLNFILRNRYILLLLFDLSERESLQSTVKEWLENILCDFPYKKIYLIGNKLDKHSPTEQERQEYLDVAKKYDLTFLECSAKEGTGVKEIFQIVASDYFATSKLGTSVVKDVVPTSMQVPKQDA